MATRAAGGRCRVWMGSSGQRGCLSGINQTDPQDITHDWSLQMDNLIEQATLSFEGKKYAFRQSKDGMVFSFLLHPDDLPSEIATSPIGTRYMVACVELNDVEEPVAPRQRTEGQRAMARAHAICREASYQDWVRLNAARWGHDPQGLTAEEFAVEIIRVVCEIDSRSELQTDPDACDRLSEHLREFEHSLNRSRFGQNHEL